MSGQVINQVAFFCPRGLETNKISTFVALPDKPSSWLAVKAFEINETTR